MSKSNRKAEAKRKPKAKDPNLALVHEHWDTLVHVLAIT